MNHLFLFLTIVAYVGSLVFYLGFLNTGKETIGRLGTLLLGVGLVAHYFALLERSRGLTPFLTTICMGRCRFLGGFLR